MCSIQFSTQKQLESFLFHCFLPNEFSFYGNRDGCGTIQYLKNIEPFVFMLPLGFFLFSGFSFERFHLHFFQGLSHASGFQGHTHVYPFPHTNSANRWAQLGLGLGRERNWVRLWGIGLE